jgi:hypothetical protein
MNELSLTAFHFLLTVNVKYSASLFICKIYHQHESVDQGFAQEIACSYSAIMDSIIADPKQDISTLLSAATFPPPQSFSLLPQGKLSGYKRQAAMQCDIPTSSIEEMLPITPLQNEVWTDTEQNHVAQHVLRSGPLHSMTFIKRGKQLSWPLRRCVHVSCASRESGISK